MNESPSPHSAPALLPVVAAVGALRGLIGAAGARVQPPRGAVHHDHAQGRRHRLLHVPQLRAGPRPATSR